jgi:enoyl-CoA hydratase
MPLEFLRVERLEASALVTIDRQEVLNALDGVLLDEMGQVFSALAREADLRAVILTGAGKAFVAGADIKAMARLSADEALAFARRGQAVTNTVAAFPRPVIAAVNGFALGGGCELALACDLRIGSERARLGQPEVTLGVPPGFGGTQRLSRLVGPSVAKRLLFTGELLDAARALAIGLLDEVVPPEGLLPRCIELAAQVARQGPAAVAACKQAVDAGLDGTLAAGLETEARLFGAAFGSREQREGMAAFLEKRPARFSGI